MFKLPRATLRNFADIISLSRFSTPTHPPTHPPTHTHTCRSIYIDICVFKYRQIDKFLDQARLFIYPQLWRNSRIAIIILGSSQEQERNTTQFHSSTGPIWSIQLLHSKPLLQSTPSHQIQHEITQLPTRRREVTHQTQSMLHRGIDIDISLSRPLLQTKE